MMIRGTPDRDNFETDAKSNNYSSVNEMSDTDRAYSRN